MARKMVNSLTDTHYWDRTWSGRPVPDPLDPRMPGLNGVVPRSWHGYFSAAFRELGIREGDRLLEAGCGGSVFLPYFRSQFSLVAEGIDNSPEGCDLSTAIARNSGVQTNIVCGDVFNPPHELLQRYRIVFSMGLAEHFTPTQAIIEALSKFVEPGGWLITVIPNMHGIIGVMQRFVDPDVYRVHVPLSPVELARAHQASGLTVVEQAHVMTVNFSVVNFSGPRSRVAPRIGLRLASWASKAVWSFERLGLPEFPNGVTSPYVVVIALKSRHGVLS